MHRSKIPPPPLILLSLLLLESAVASPLPNVHANETEEPRERAPEMQKPVPQLPQITLPFQFFPNAFQPQLPFTFPFQFPTFTPWPSGRAADLPRDLQISGGAQTRRDSSSDKRKQKKKKKQKKQKNPKPMTSAAYQKDELVDGGGTQPGFAGNFVNGNQGSYAGYYMVYLVEVSWNGSNQTQTIIAGTPILTTKPEPTEPAQITDLSEQLTSGKPPPEEQCLLQRSTTTDHIKPSQATDKPGHGNDAQEVIGEELDTGEEYEDESDSKKAVKKSKSKSSDAVPTF